jgi:hypothetical protein
MGTGNKKSNRSKEQKLQQILHCQRVKPWLKSTGPKTAEGKAKVTLNLPSKRGKVNKIAQGLLKLDKALSKLQRAQERAKKRQLAAIEKLEKLAKKGEKS